MLLLTFAQIHSFDEKRQTQFFKHPKSDEGTTGAAEKSVVAKTRYRWNLWPEPVLRVATELPESGRSAPATTSAGIGASRSLLDHAAIFAEEAGYQVGHDLRLVQSGKVTRVDNMNFRLRSVTQVRERSRSREEVIATSPDHRIARSGTSIDYAAEKSPH